MLIMLSASSAFSVFESMTVSCWSSLVLWVVLTSVDSSDSEGPDEQQEKTQFDIDVNLTDSLGTNTSLCYRVTDLITTNCVGFRVAISLKKLPHPWKNPWNPWISCQSLKSLKSPWILVKILEDPWKVLEFGKWSLKSLNSVISATHHMLILWIAAATRQLTSVGPSLNILENREKILKNILELSLNFVDGISWQPCM